MCLATWAAETSTGQPKERSILRCIALKMSCLGCFELSDDLMSALPSMPPAAGMDDECIGGSHLRFRYMSFISWRGGEIDLHSNIKCGTIIILYTYLCAHTLRRSFCSWSRKPSSQTSTLSFLSLNLPIRGSELAANLVFIPSLLPSARPTSGERERESEGLTMSPL